MRQFFNLYFVKEKNELKNSMGVFRKKKIGCKFAETRYATFVSTFKLRDFLCLHNWPHYVVSSVFDFLNQLFITTLTCFFINWMRKRMTWLKGIGEFWLKENFSLCKLFLSYTAQHCAILLHLFCYRSFPKDWRSRPLDG